MKLTIGIPNGSLNEATLKLFRRVGVEVGVNGRSFEANIEGGGIFSKALILRPQDIPLAIMRGVIDAGICGYDCLAESGFAKSLTKVVYLNYSKKTNQPTKIVVFGKSEKLVDSPDIAITTEYPNITRKFFKKAKIDFSYGTTEAKVVAGIYDYGVCVTETGDSLSENNLKILKTLLISPTVFIARKNIPEIMYFGKILAGGLKAKEFQLVKMDVGRAIKDKILSILPAIQSPTVNSLADDSFAIETVVSKRKISKLIIELQKIGARGILVQDINIIL